MQAGDLKDHAFENYPVPSLLELQEGGRAIAFCNYFPSLFGLEFRLPRSHSFGKTLPNTPSCLRRSCAALFPTLLDSGFICLECLMMCSQSQLPPVLPCLIPHLKRACTLSASKQVFPKMVLSSYYFPETAPMIVFKANCLSKTTSFPMRSSAQCASVPCVCLGTRSGNNKSPN